MSRGSTMRCGSAAGEGWLEDDGIIGSGKNKTPTAWFYRAVGADQVGALLN